MSIARPAARAAHHRAGPRPPRLQHVGLCPGGAMDPVALALANALVGNDAGEAALEITVIGPELQFEQRHAGRAVRRGVPGRLPAQPAGARARRQRASTSAARCAARAPTSRSRAASRVEPVLGSRSTYLPGRFGGFEGRALQARRRAAAARRRGVARALRSAEENAGTARVRWSAPPLTLPDREPILVHVIEGAALRELRRRLAARVLRHGVDASRPNRTAWAFA